MKNTKVKSKKVKISEEEKREKIRDALIKKKSFEEKALKIVEQMLETGLSADFILDSANFLNQEFYKDAVEERSLTGLCGYPLCDNKKPTYNNKGKYHISLRDKKVYDLDERKFFCSNICFKASNFLKNQLETSPLWLRETEKVSKVTLYEADQKEATVLRGEVIDIGLIKDVTLEEGKVDTATPVMMDENDLNCEVNASDDNDDDYGANNLENLKISSFKESGKEEHRTKAKSNAYLKNDTKSDPPEEVAFTAMKDWFTIDSFRVIYGDENLKQRLRECNVSKEVWVTAIGDKDLEEQYQVKYRDLCRKLDILEMLEEREDVAEDHRLPMPSFEMLKKHCEEENMKMEAFLAGKQSYGKDLVSGIMEKDGDDEEPRIPLLDHRAQQQLRRRLVFDSFQRTFPEVLKLLKLTFDEIRADLKQLINSFKFSADNVVFKSDEWTLLAIIILKFLSEKNSSVKSALSIEEHKKLLELVLLSYQLDLSKIDQVLRDITADIKILVANYQIK